MTVQIDRTGRAAAQCGTCGWWDMSMKYGQFSKCTRCGAELLVPAGENTAN